MSQSVRDAYDAAKGFGAMLGGYYAGMVEAGMSPDEARLLTVEYFRMIMAVTKENVSLPTFRGPEGLA